MPWFRFGLLAFILVVASALRFADLGGLSLWFDEVVTMRLARQPDPAALLRLLHQTDATRAPLHPLLLQAWVAFFGPSDTGGRAFSALCGVLTVLLVFQIGRIAFDSPTGLWAAWLAAVSPLLVQYSREARMYAWLVLVTCLAWLTLFDMVRGSFWWKRLLYVAALAALGYSHPLGLLMIAALALATLVNRRTLGLSIRTWLALHAAATLLLVPWLPNYLDHEPSISSTRWLALPYVLGLPIGFVGGNRWALLGCAAVVAWGLVKVSGRRPRLALDRSFAASMLLFWFIVPPALLYVGSLLGTPIFGQARYTLFVGPAYLLLLGRGLARLPKPLVFTIACVLAVYSAMLMRETVYAPDLKADWRAASALIRREDPVGANVLVFSEDPRWTREVEVARYYLGPRFDVLPAAKAPPDWLRDGHPLWQAVGLRDGHPVAPIPRPILDRSAPPIDLPGLRLIRSL